MTCLGIKILAPKVKYAQITQNEMEIKLYLNI